MADKTLNVRLVLRKDTYDNWITNDPVLLSGEVAIAFVTAENAATANIAAGTALKIGDGSSKFSELGWVEATAGDVAAWAKAATKPAYTAAEITGLADYISGEIQDTNTAYKISVSPDTATGNVTYTLQSKDVGETDWTNVSTFTVTIPIKKVMLGTNELTPSADGTVTLPDYPTTLPASDVAAWAKAAEKPTYEYSEIQNTPDLSVYALKTEVASVLNYKGVKATTDDLPTENNTIGDVWIVTANNSEHVWNGTSWEELGPTLDLSGYATSSQLSALAGRLDDLTTDDVAEGTNNLYYTEARATANFKTHASTELTDTASILYTTDTLTITCGSSATA